MDLSSEHQWLPAPNGGDNQAMYLLMKEHTITYSLAKGIEHRADLATNLEKMQRSEDYVKTVPQMCNWQNLDCRELYKSCVPDPSTDKL